MTTKTFLSELPAKIFLDNGICVYDKEDVVKMLDLVFNELEGVQETVNWSLKSIDKQKLEIERTKDLIEKAFDVGYSANNRIEAESYWQQFKIENDLL